MSETIWPLRTRPPSATAETGCLGEEFAGGYSSLGGLWRLSGFFSRVSFAILSYHFSFQGKGHPWELGYSPSWFLRTCGGAPLPFTFIALRCLVSFFLSSLEISACRWGCACFYRRGSCPWYISGEPGSGCEKAIRNAYMNLIFNAPKTVLAQVQITAAIRTLLSGGTRTITDYIGLEHPQEQYDQLIKYDPTSLSRFLLNIYKINPAYMILFVLITTFPLVTRGLGLIGVIRAVSNPRCHAHLLFHLMMISLLLLLYGLQGWSRFRVPMEPILMIFTATAFAKLVHRESAIDH